MKEFESLFKRFWFFLIIPVGFLSIITIFSILGTIDIFYSACSYRYSSGGDLGSFLHIEKCPVGFGIFFEIIAMSTGFMNFELLLCLFLVLVVWIIEIPFFIKKNKKCTILDGEITSMYIQKILFWTVPLMIVLFIFLLAFFKNFQIKNIKEQKHNEQVVVFKKIASEASGQCSETLSGVHLIIKEVIIDNSGGKEKRFSITFPEGFLSGKGYVVISPKNYWNGSLDTYHMFSQNQYYSPSKFSDFSLNLPIEFSTDIYNLSAKYSLSDYDLRIFLISNDIETIYIDYYKIHNPRFQDSHMKNPVIKDLFEYPPGQVSKDFFEKHPIYASNIFQGNKDCITVKLDI